MSRRETIQPGKALRTDGVRAISIAADSLIDHVSLGGRELRLGEVLWVDDVSPLVMLPAGPRVALTYRSVSAWRWTATFVCWADGETPYPAQSLAPRAGEFSLAVIPVALPASPHIVIPVAGMRSLLIAGGCAVGPGTMSLAMVRLTRLEGLVTAARSLGGLISTLNVFGAAPFEPTRQYGTNFKAENYTNSADGVFSVDGVDEVWVYLSAVAGSGAEVVWSCR